MIESSEIDRMSLAERLQAMERLWDSVCCDASDLASPEWHGKILAERKARAERGEAKFLTLAQLRSRLHAPDP